MEKYCIKKGIKSVMDYMANLGFASCTTLNENCLYFGNHPYRNYGVKVTFSPKGRCIKLEKVIEQ